MLETTLEIVLLIVIVVVVIAWLVTYLSYRNKNANFKEKVEMLKEQSQKLENQQERLAKANAEQEIYQQQKELLRQKEQELKEQSQKIENQQEFVAKANAEQEMLKQHSAQIGELKAELKNLQNKFSAKQTELEKYKTYQEHYIQKIDESQKQITEQTEKLESQQQELSQAHELVQKMKIEQEEQDKRNKDKEAFLKQQEEQMRERFENLANKILESKGKEFSEQNKERLNGLLNPFNEQLKEFKKKIEDIYVNEGKERASLKQEVHSLMGLNKQLSQDAINLTDALKGDKKQQGNWGELILERVLEQSGLRKGSEYEAQASFKDADDHLRKPDVIVRLPEKKDMIIDSKVSLNAYEQYSSAETEEEQKNCLAKHIASIRNHIKTLSAKDYSSLKGLNTLDFVLMFIPIEPAFMIAFQHDDKLFSDAFERKIIVVTPTTLLATLRTVANIWKYERQNRNTESIIRQVGAMYDKVRGFAEDFEKVGKQLGQANDSYDSALKKLSTGKGNLITLTQKFVSEYGVSVKKEIPQSMLGGFEAETESDTHSLEVKNHGELC